MINETEQERQEQIQDSIEETQEQIENIQLVVQKLNILKDTTTDRDVKSDVNSLIEKYKNDITYLEDIKESDENTLQILI